MQNNNNILNQVPSEVQIKRELKKVIFGERIFCPRCGSYQVRKSENRYRCKKCRKPFSLTSVSWLKSMKISLQTFWLLLWGWTNEVPLDQTQALCGLSEVTVRNWYEKFRLNLPQDKIEAVRLCGDIQMDEAYRGRKDNKYSIIGAKEKAQQGKDRKMYIQVLHKNSIDRKNTIDFLSQKVIPNSNLFTDGGSIYKGIGKWWPVNHQYEIHSKFEFTLTSEIEGLWGTMFTFIRRMYHHVTYKKVDDLVFEFMARQMFPKWFESPQSFVSVAFVRLERQVKRPDYRVQKKNIICTTKIPKSTFVTLPNYLSTVPSC